MTISGISIRVAALAAALSVLFPGPGTTDSPRHTADILLEDFSRPNWEKNWSEERLSSGHNIFSVIPENGNDVLNVVSHSAAGGLWRKFERKPLSAGTISWRWKVEKSLASNRRERERAGDDYAARVKVIFEDRFPIWNTRILSYVWAGNEPAGATYRNPYSRNVGTIVIESGDAKTGVWVREERDIVADYIRFFGVPPREISGVALMVDTDNTKSEALAFFDDVRVEAE